MTVFDLAKDEQGDWFAYFDSHIDPVIGETVYDPPIEGAAEFRIRSMAPFFDERRKERKKEFKMVLNPSTRGMERVGYYPDLPPDEAEKENQDAWDYAITGIKNAFSAPGVEIKCTRENKLALIEIPAFMRFLFRVFQIISDTGAKAREESEGN
uniref:Uncharacterized protein n=1 Tax=viral metagenome TaxID=1070528 RepID=A0A6H1ZD23_9ZZZZ